MAEVPLSMMRVTSPVLRIRCHLRSRSMAFWNMSTLIDLRQENASLPDTATWVLHAC